MATHSSVLAWRIPGTGEPGGLLSRGSHRVGHDWSDLAAAATGLFIIQWNLDLKEEENYLEGGCLLLFFNSRPPLPHTPSPAPPDANYCLRRERREAFYKAEYKKDKCSAWCTGKTQRDGVERGVGGGIGMGIHVNPWLIHVNVWQKSLQYCKVVSLQLIKINEKRKKERALLGAVFSFFNNNFICLFLAVLGPHCCSGFSLVLASRGFSLAAVPGFLTAVALVARHTLRGSQASVIAAHGLSSWGSLALEHRLYSCGAQV